MEGDSGWKTHVKNPKSFFSMFRWAALRNPTNGFKQVALYSFVLNDINRRLITYKGDKVVGDQSSGGWQLVRLGSHVGFYGVFPYRNNSGRCLRIRIGYKIVPGDKSNGRIQMTFVINPFMPYTGV